MSAPLVGALLYASAFALIESIGAQGESLVAVWLHCALIAVLLAQAAWRPSGRLAAFLVALAVVSLLRVLSFGLLFGGLAPPARAALVAVPLLLAVRLALRLPGLSRDGLGLRPRAWWLQGLIGLTGVPLGAAAVEVGLTLGIPAPGPWPRLVAVALAWAFAGVVEELVFRGVLLQAAVGVAGRGGFVLAAAVSTAAYAAAGSMAALGLAAAVGLLLGVCAQQSRSVVGVAVAHALLNVGAVLVWARLLG